MEYPIQYLATLANVDINLDDLNEEYGDLPQQVKEAGNKLLKQKNIVNETEGILAEVKKFITETKQKLINLKDNEEKLSKQQFSVRNNKEFDAISKEIAFSKQEHTRLSDELRNAFVKDENLVKMLEQQKKDLKEAETEVKEKEEELELISQGQTAELKELYEKRKEIISHIDSFTLSEYERIREYHHDAVVKIRKNSCSGCFSSVPPQLAVEIRNNLDTIFACEHCGRFIYPEDLAVY
jgi:uncharacterized protein